MDNRTIEEIRKNETLLIEEIKGLIEKNQELKKQLEQLKENNRKYKEVIDKMSKIIYEIDESRKTTGGYPSNYIDDLLSILKEVEHEQNI